MTQVVLVTGATDGLGRAVSVELARSGATVLVHGRTRDGAEEAVAEIRAASGSELLRACVGDLASLAQVRSLAESVVATEPRLDVLVNNAGIGTVEPGGGARVESADGHELRFAVNYLAPFLLTRLLEPLLLRLRSSPDRERRRRRARHRSTSTTSCWSETTTAAAPTARASSPW